MTHLSRTAKRSAFRVVDNTDKTPAELYLIAVRGIGPGQRFRAEERNGLVVPLISMLLGDFYRMGGLIDAGPQYGLQVSARLDFLYRGVGRSVVGAVVPLVDGPELILPAGFLNRD